jgi:hypothetical protein
MPARVLAGVVAGGLVGACLTYMPARVLAGVFAGGLVGACLHLHACT